MSNASQATLKRLLDGLRARELTGEQRLAELEQVRGEASTEDAKVAKRLLGLWQRAQIHSRGDGTQIFRQADDPQDEQWLDAVVDAIRSKRGRPAHPDPEIEEFLAWQFP